jgi:hypothetical protein
LIPCARGWCGGTGRCRYIKHAAADHHLSRYVTHLEAASGRASLPAPPSPLRPPASVTRHAMILPPSYPQPLNAAASGVKHRLSVCLSVDCVAGYSTHVAPTLWQECAGAVCTGGHNSGSRSCLGRDIGRGSSRIPSERRQHWAGKPSHRDDWLCYEEPPGQQLRLRPHWRRHRCAGT